MIEREAVIKQYNWRGEVVAYQKKDAWIPVGGGNHISREVEEQIQQGSCLLLEPDIPLVYNSYNESKIWNGYLYNGMYIPNDENNQLFRLIGQYIATGACVVSEAPKAELFGEKKIKEFIVGMHFDSQWLSINNEITAKVDYFLGDSSPFSYNVRFKNLTCNHSSTIEEIILSEHKMPPYKFPFDSGESRGAILEITIPTNRTGNIFRKFLNIMHDQKEDISFIEDQLEMHLAQTGRKRKDPRIDWLIANLFCYLDDFILDVGNRALDLLAFLGGSYESQNLKHITHQMLFSRNYIIRKYCDDTCDLHKGSMFREQRFLQLEQHNSVLNDCVPYNIVNKTDSTSTFWIRVNDLPLKKVKVMIDAGLTLEALCILNGYLEVTYKIALRLAFSNDVMRKQIINLKHIDVLDVVKNINKNVFNDYFAQKGEEYRKDAREIYRLRNAYIHNLETPEEPVFLTNVTRHLLEKHMSIFIDSYEGMLFMQYINMFRDNKPIQSAVIEQIKKKMKY